MRAFFRRHRSWIIALALLAPCLWFASHDAALAQSVTSNEILPGEIGAEIGTGTTDIRITIARIIRVGLGLLGTIALMLILYAGFTWMTAAGDESKVQRAKKILSGAVIGLAIIMSAFAIVSYVLSALITATTGGPGGGGPGGGGGGGGGFGGGSGGAFRPTAIQPAGSLGKYDVTAAVTFSAAPTDDATNIRANILLEKVEGTTRTNVDYEPVVENFTIRLRPVTPCPAPNADRRCLEQNSDYQITVRAGLRNASTSDPRTVSCGLGAMCSQSFRTGDTVLTEPPTVTISSPTDGQSVPAGDLVPIQAVLTDEAGIASVEYLADGAFFTAEGNILEIAPSTYMSEAVWDTAGLVPVRTVSLSARAFNIDGDNASSSAVRVTVRPQFCFNNVRDGDEVGVDCGGSCGACSGGACTQNGQCASGLCQNGQCVENPQITDVQLRDGRPGNLVTITGDRFGSSGTVTFMGTAATGDEQDATVAQCANAWSDTRIVVLVPQGAVTGPIRVTASGGRTDATNDAYGPIITDFQVNDVARPGICSVAPTSVKTGNTVTVTGVAFGGAQGASRVQLTRAGSDCSQIQDWATAAEASQVSPWSETSFSPTIPNVETDFDGSNFLLRVTVGGQPSNTACIRVEPPEAGTEPRIEYLTPEDGSVGTYMSVFGSNFGSGGTVRFRNAAGEAVGDISFPAQCAAGYWTNASVTVKVPARFTTPADTAVALGAYNVTVVRSDGRASNAVPFTINTDPLTPGLCRVEPDNGPVGTSVTLYGDGFGTISAADLPAFTTLHPDAVRFNDNRNAASIGQWQSSSIAASVPDGATTGPVRVRTFVGATPAESNGVNFQVRDCRESGGDAACGSGRSCCDDGACRASCGAPAAAGGFAWQFSTGPIPIFPIVMENATCQVSPPSAMPSPNPFKGMTDVCTDMGAMTARFSLPMDPATINASNVLFEACGTGATISNTCAAVASAGAPSLVDYDTDGRSQLVLPVNGLQPNTWYRLTIRDQVQSLGTPERGAQSLDGNFDSRAGGAYVTSFKTGAGPCTLSGVDVQPGNALISAADETKDYQAFPLSSRCVILSCDGRTVNWVSTDPGKATIVSLGGSRQCEAVATPVSETDPGPPIQIRSTVDGFADSGTLTVDYANPRVVDYGPHDCDQACVNSVSFAYFNTPMAESGPGSILSNVRLYRCRNESCLAFEGEVPLAPSYSAPSRLLSFGNPVLAANTWYRAVILGTAESTSQAPLTGLNYEGNAFSWIFRTRLSGDPCGPQRVIMEPSQTTLRFIGEVSPVTALPLSSPDACAANGQILNAASYNWSWSKAQTPAAPVAFSFLPDVPPGTLINTNPILPTGCSTSCLMTGSQPPGTPACGNGTLERGEACDTPGLNGCNANCLLTGNTLTNGCGDSTVQADRGEECDAGAANGTAAAGCTTACLLVGSTPGLSACGNGSTGVGEACDDGNSQGGDGCGSRCLLEGSRQNVYVCGNGALEPGEQCDYILGAGGLATQLLVAGRPPAALGATDERNPTRPNFACGQSCLLRGNPVTCTAGTNCCGNGVIEPAKGENCDAAGDNGEASSGCSTRCTKTGSDPELRAFCGDTVVTVKPGDVLTGVQNGGGEECEAPALDANIDPKQVVEARNQCDARNNCNASVTAAIGTVSGQGSVNVECSCRADSDCSAFGPNLSCGAGACCFPRPDAPDINPKGGNECRNVQISVQFGEEMNTGSLQGGLVVESCPSHAFNENGPRSWFARAASSVGRFFRSLVGLEVSASHLCGPIEGTFTHTNVSAPDGTVRTRSTFAPRQMLSPARLYRVTVRGGATGVKTAKGVGYPEGVNTIQDFTTGNDVCRFDVVQTSPATELIQDSAIPLTITATAMTDRGGRLEAIAPVPGVYDWTWSWATIPENASVGAILDLTAAAGAPSATVQATKGINGQEQVAATARITTDTALTPSTAGEDKIGKSSITVMLCQMPWPRRNILTGAWAPYVDPQTHFEFYYCRDNAGASLPELMPQPVQGQSVGGSGLTRFCAATTDFSQPRACVTNADCNAGDTCRSKDLLFRFQPEWRVSDAIGMRVYENSDRLTPQEWYVAQRFSGKTQAATVDGYQAIKDERTVYVGAADKYGDPDIRSYIYVFAYNDNADPRTAEIFNRLVGNVNFNTNLVPSDRVTNVCKNAAGEILHLTAESTAPITCSTDLDCVRALPAGPADMRCDADKDKIRRDMRRWQDMRVIEGALETTREQTGFYPKVESGSFVRGFTTSKWPSWSQQLGPAGAVVDPINAFNRCEAFGSECSITRTSCAADGDCTGGAGDVCRPTFEAESCYNDKLGVFACPAHSHVYQYRSIGGIDYRMSVDFEYVTYQWLGTSCASKASLFACEAALGCSWIPTGPTTGNCTTRISITPVCAGLPSPTAPKACLATGAACTASAQCGVQDVCMPIGVPLVGPAAGGACGNGLLEGTEACEIGMTRNVACASGGQSLESCNAACQWQVQTACPGAAACGNGSLETFAGESCDDGAQNGQYGRCRSGSLGCVKRCVNIAKRASFDGNCADGSCDLAGSCATNSDCSGLAYPAVCTDRMNFCGDGVRNGSETCDDGANNGEYGFCAWDCRGAGPRCGDGDTNGAEDCDGNQATAPGVCIPSSSTLADTNGASSAYASCSSTSDCASGQTCALCAATPGGLPQTRAKSCKPATEPVGEACTFNDWSVCRPSGACGNGVVEGAEQCDAGAANSPNGTCLTTCRLNVCNDGFVRSGVEQCDNGAANGVLCTPQYGSVCNYCKNDCSIETISGAFCGDRTITAPPETCDPGPVTAWCSRTYQNQADPSGVKGCTTNNDCLPGVCRNYPGASSPSAAAPSKQKFARSDVEIPMYGPLGEAALRFAGTIATFATCGPGECNAGVPGDTTPPVIGPITTAPTSPTTADSVVITVSNVTDAAALVDNIDIYLTTAGVKVLRQTCRYNPRLASAACSVNVGALSAGIHVISIDAFDGNGNMSTRDQNLTVTTASGGGPPRVDDGTGGLGFDPGYTPYTGTGTAAPEGAPCRSASDCVSGQYCQGGEGQCIAFNTQCQPEPYTNTQAAATARKCKVNGRLCTNDAECGANGPCVAYRMDGSCNYCSNACFGTNAKSPAFCGDSVKQGQFGEQCDGQGDPQARGQGTTYVCRNDCVYDPNGGYCGDGVIHSAYGEVCDNTTFAGGAAPSCASQGAGTAGQVLCSRGCGLYTGGCDNGTLLPGDFRFKISWPTPHNAANEVDLYVKAVYSSGPLAGQTKYFGWKASAADTRYVGNGNFANDHIRLFWDVTGGTHATDPEIMVLSTQSLPQGTYHVFANGGSCFVDGNYANMPLFDRNSGWWKAASATVKSNSIFTIESGSDASVSDATSGTTRLLSSVSDISGNPCMWYIGRIDKTAASPEGRFVMKNKYVNRADGPNASD